jgi:hypothetical protein
LQATGARCASTASAFGWPPEYGTESLNTTRSQQHRIDAHWFEAIPLQ